MPLPPRRSRAAGAYAPAIKPGTPRTFECPQCGARAYERCYRMVGDQQKMMVKVHIPRMRAARDAGYRGRGPVPAPGSPRGGTPVALPPES